MARKVDIKAIISHIVRGDGLNKCRICMGSTKEGQVFLTDTVMKDAGKSVTLGEVLLSITGLEMQLQMDLPTGICSKCLKMALNAAAFRILCFQAYNNWNTVIELLEDIPSKIDNQKSLYAVINHNQMTIVQTPKTSFLPDINVKQESLKLDTPKSRLVCPDCNKPFEHPQQIFNHLKDSSNFKRACYICGDILKRHLLVSHIKKTHNIVSLYCKKCLAVFGSQDQLYRHNSKYHMKKNECVDCGLSFKSTQALHSHISIHTAKLCPKCDEEFQNQKCYLHHFKNCLVQKHKLPVEMSLLRLKDKKCSCDYCGKVFANKKVISAHMQIVHLKNTHQPCKICGKLLAAAHMQQHVKTHAFNHPYKCEHCGMVFKSRLGHKQHLRLHSGERPYACSQCGEAFSTSSLRSEHMQKIHKSSSLNHKCNLCPAVFHLPCKLKRHLSNVHSNEYVQEMKYKCTNCKQRFSTSRGLVHHAKIHQDVSFKRIVKRDASSNVLYLKN